MAEDTTFNRKTIGGAEEINLELRVRGMEEGGDERWERRYCGEVRRG